MKISIISTGDPSKIVKYSRMNAEELSQLSNDIGKLLAKKGHELILVPDKGLHTEIAEAYKKNKGKKIYGMIPKNDTKFGIDNTKPYIRLVDEKIEYEHWFDVDGEIAASGDICLAVGLSPGIMRQICALKYHYKFFNSKTKLIWFENTISQPIQKEIQEEVPIIYVNSISDLEQFV
ncbi:hypothetical protein M1141_01500 [Candidatus Marsarchaeota archaeon]|nr:hypothetical protein [Candidatus Marsarchaeota archaeon]